MQFLILALLSVVGLAIAAPRSGPPACANSCIMSAFKDTGCNQNGNPVKCLCQKTDYHPKMRECAQKSCQAGEFSKALQSARDSCKKEGISISI